MRACNPIPKPTDSQRKLPRHRANQIKKSAYTRKLEAAFPIPVSKNAFGLPPPVAKTILRANQPRKRHEAFIDTAIQPMEPPMNTGFNRRQFLAATGAAAAIGATGNLAQANLLNNAPAKEELFEISLAQWSLHRTLRSGKLDNLDFAKTAKEEFGITGIEYVNQFFKDKAGDEKYLGEMKKRAADHGVESVLIMIDGEGALGDANEAARKGAIEEHHLSASWKMNDIPLEVPLSLLFLRRLAQRHDAVSLLVHVPRDSSDSPTFSGRVPTLKENDHRNGLFLQVALQFEEFDLIRPEGSIFVKLVLQLVALFFYFGNLCL